MNFTQFYEYYSFTNFILGALFILLAFHFFNYFLNNEKVYLYYSLYVLTLLIYFSFKTKLSNSNALFNKIEDVFNYPIQPFIYVFYVLFLRALLNTKLKLPKWDKTLIISIWFLIISAMLMFLVRYTLGTQTAIFLVVTVAIIATVYAVINNLVLLFYLKTRLVYLFLIGSTLYLALVTVSLYMSIKIGYYKSVYDIATVSMMQLGALLESLVFSIIISYKMKINKEEKQKTQFLLIEQYKKNERETKLKLESEKKLILTELKALRARVNPHFLFNSLNSIKSFVIKKDVDTAIEYIDKFSKLMRHSVDDSTKEYVPLKNEIDFLNNYLCIEKLRFSKKFNYKITVDKRIVINKVFIPPLIIQPFIENSIWHGLLPKKARGKITIEFRLIKTYISVLIIDNGIGIKKSKKAKHNFDKKNNKPQGIKITLERLSLINKDVLLKKLIQIEEIKKNNKVVGTKICIKLPYRKA